MAWISYKHLNKIFEREFTHGQRLVLIGLCRYADKEGGNIYPSMARLAYDINYSEKQVKRIIKELREKQVLIAMGKKKAGNIIFRLEIENAAPKESYDTFKERQAKPDNPEAKYNDWGEIELDPWDDIPY
jgi:hypothetical protein